MTSQRELTIGIDARAAAEVPAGRGRTVRELLRALGERERDGHRYLLYARRPWEGVELDERFTWRTIAAPDPWWHLLAARRANRECDVFLSTNSYLTVWFLRIPAVPIVYDLATFEPTMRPNRRSAVIERLTLGHAVRRSAALLAISQATAEALCARFPAARERTAVVHLGAAPASVEALVPEQAAELPPPGFVLAVGTLEPRKNLPRLVEAFATLAPELQLQHPLVVVGALGWDTGETLEALRSLGPRARMLGFVSDAALAELYRRCGVFCYPSLGEGFGLPVLEAMSAGAPTVTSNLSSLPEVGGEAAEYVDPFDVGSIAAGIERLLCDEARREQLHAAGPRRAAEFSWEAFAERTLALLQSVSRRS
ncbi:MAG TPA: glycosyltransferase family 1 protein [Solirubrobacteraceae bacterium]|jgi:alpha-1,3-rhamnosyl/mannosyltransferase|nr:glycosyltransferase family 1 protein [Solirubrobacteraceae bacterium]